MENVIKGSIVTHAHSGATAIVISKWLNPWTNQIVLNVRLVHNHQVAMWNSLSVMGGAA